MNRCWWEKNRWSTLRVSLRQNPHEHPNQVKWIVASDEPNFVSCGKLGLRIVGGAYGKSGRGLTLNFDKRTALRRKWANEQRKPSNRVHSTLANDPLAEWMENNCIAEHWAPITIAWTERTALVFTRRTFPRQLWRTSVHTLPPLLIADR